MESHFGSEGRSPTDSTTEEESEKKESFFNITIKSKAPPTQTATGAATATGAGDADAKPTLSNGLYHSNVKPKGEPAKPQKYFQGISGWSERKETTPARKLATKTFQDELKGTLERNRLRHVASSGDMTAASAAAAAAAVNRFKDDIAKSDEDDPARKSNINGNKADTRYGSRGDLKTQKEDLGYMSGSRTDIRAQRRHDSKEDLYAKSSKKQQSSYLHREDSGK